MYRILTIILAAFLFILGISVSYAEETGDSMAGIGGYSDGYRMGRITKFSVKGIFAKSGEGEMMMGKDSDVWVIYTKDSDGKKVTNVRNPWSFSTSKNAAELLSKYQGKYVWVKYNQAMISSPGRDTPYTIAEITPVTKTSPKCSATTNDTGMKSEGTRTGRVVKASRKGAVVDTWEVTLHMGGKLFQEMSISDENVYNCAVEWLKSGKEVNVSYVQKMINFSFNETSYRIIKIGETDDLD